MTKWKPAEDDAFSQAHVKLSEVTREVLSTLGFPVEDSKRALNADTVQLWINYLGKFLATAEELCQKTDAVSLEDLANHLIGINDILELPEVQKVFHKTASFDNVFTSM